MEFLLGSKEEFNNFVNLISPEDRIGIVSHNDLDGLASAFLLEKILESKGLKVEELRFIDYGVVESSFDDLKEKGMNKFFMTDIYADGTDFDSFERVFGSSELFLIDHHPMAEGTKKLNNIIKTPSHFCTTLSVYELAKDYFEVSEYNWLLDAALIADRCYFADENFELLKSRYPSLTLDEEVIRKSEPGEMMQDLGSAIIFYQKNISHAYDLIKKKDFEEIKKTRKEIDEEFNFWVEEFEKRAEYYPEKHLYYFYAAPKFGITSAITTYISLEKTSDYIIFMSDSLTDEGMCKVSARGQPTRFDMSELLKAGIENIPDSRAGGHKRAAGGSFPKKYLEKFRENILNSI